MDPDSGQLGYIHRFVPGTGEATLLLLHGTGGSEEDLLGLGRALSDDAALLSPRGNVSERGALRFFRRLAEGVLDEADVAVRAGDLARFVAEAAERYGFDPAKVVAAGFSNGANAAAAMMLLHPGVLRGGVLFAPMPPLTPDPLPDLSGAAAFLSAGRADPLVPPEQAVRLAALLTQAGASVALRWHPGGHTVDMPGVAEARAWLTKLTAAMDAGDPLP